MSKTTPSSPEPIRIEQWMRGDADLRLKWAEELKRFRYAVGLNQSALGKNAEIGRANINHYFRGRTVPNEEHQVALANALKITPAELMAVFTQAAARQKAGSSVPPGAGVAVQMVGEDRAHIHLDKEIPWATAVEILNLLKKDA